MKSETEFTSKEAYAEYLRIYFSGLAMSGLIEIFNGSIHSRELAKRSIESADELIKQLKIKDEII